MPFINESISEQDKTRIDWKSFTSSPVDNIGIWHPWKWTIDRERDVFLIGISMGKEDGPPAAYGLSWKGHFIRVLANIKFTKGPHRPLVNWDILRIDIPDSLESKRAEIVCLLREAITAYGLMYEPADVGPINIRF